MGAGGLGTVHGPGTLEFAQWAMVKIDHAHWHSGILSMVMVKMDILRSNIVAKFKVLTMENFDFGHGQSFYHMTRVIFIFCRFYAFCRYHDSKSADLVAAKSGCLTIDCPPPPPPLDMTQVEL